MSAHIELKDLAKHLRYAAQTAQNDDQSEVGTTLRSRHVDRVNVMLEAAEELEQLAERLQQPSAEGVTSPCEPIPDAWRWYSARAEEPTTKIKKVY